MRLAFSSMRVDWVARSRTLQIAALVLGAFALAIYSAIAGRWWQQLFGFEAVDLSMSPRHSTVKLIAIRPAPGA